MAQYDKPRGNGHRTALKRNTEKDPEKLAKRRTEKKERSGVLTEKIVKMIESGLQSTPSVSCRDSLTSMTSPVTPVRLV